MLRVVTCLVAVALATAVKDFLWLRTSSDCKDVRTEAGLVRGCPGPRNAYMAWLGVPYAAPPTGTYRFKTLVVKVHGNGKEKMIRMLLDSGSQRTYVKAALVQELGLQVTGNEHLEHSLFGGVRQPAQPHKVITFKLSNLDDTYQINITALEQKELCGTLPKVQNLSLISNLKKHNIILTDTQENVSDISVLIGSDFLGSILEGNFIHLTDNLVAAQTKLGWTLQGPVQGVFHTQVHTHFVSTLQNPDIDFLWNLETLGIRDQTEDSTESEILQRFNDNISVNQEGRYEVGMLWNEGPELESNYEQAQKRLLSTTKRLENVKKLEGYDKVFKEWENEGIIEKIQNDDTNDGHYLSHFPVFKLESTTTKIRPVFHASCKDKNKRSLNSCLEKGPNLIELIPKLLTRFRGGAYGVISDIKKAFLQVSIMPSDRKYLKLLWWENFNEKEKMVTYQHTRVPFGVACSPFLLAATINHHLDKHAKIHPETSRRLKESFYVDNCVTSMNTQEEVKVFRKDATKLMERGKFELRGWMTNLKEKEEGKNPKIVSVLGIQWNRETDELNCNINLKRMPKEITKRDLLSITQQIFDPIGFLSPVTLVPKLVIQKAWLSKTGWDEKIPVELEKEYKAWINKIEDISQCKISRRLTDIPLQDCETSVHVFSDASIDAYAACLFLRTEHKGQVTVRLIMAKSRVAPIKRQLSLPKLELMGAVIASRLYSEVAKSGLLSSCKDYKVYCWTDSAVVVAWLKRQNTWKRFVSNRVKEICTNTNKDDWNHLPGASNPADLPSRGCDATTLLKSRWLHGPQWLYLEEEQWPKSTLETADREEEIISGEESKSTTILLEVNTEKFSNELLYFSQYKKIVRLVARLLRMSPRIRKTYNIKSKHIEYEEYKNAEETLIKLIQTETYTEEKNEEKKLLTREENGILKVKTRLEYSGEDRDFIYPILLPGKNEIVKRMIQQTHKEMKHAGTQIMMSTLRNTYWITGVRRLTKKVVSVLNVEHIRQGCMKRSLPLV